MHVIFVLLLSATCVSTGSCLKQSSSATVRGVYERRHIIIPRGNSPISSSNKRLKSSESPKKRARKDDSTPSESPNRSASHSNSSPSWKGEGFSTSTSPSDWQSQGSQWSYPHHFGKSEMGIWVKGPAVIRTRTTESKRRTFEEIPSKENVFRLLGSSDRSQAAIHLLNSEGNAGVLSHGVKTKIVVDARKSNFGGWAANIDNGDPVDLQHARPGQKLKLTAGPYAPARGFLQGKGTLKATSLVNDAVRGVKESSEVRLQAMHSSDGSEKSPSGTDRSSLGSEVSSRWRP